MQVENRRCGWRTDVDFQLSQPLNRELMTLSWLCWINQEETVLPTDPLATTLLRKRAGWDGTTKPNESNMSSRGFGRCLQSMSVSELHHSLTQRTWQTLNIPGSAVVKMTLCSPTILKLLILIFWINLKTENEDFSRKLKKGWAWDDNYLRCSGKQLWVLCPPW